MVVVTGLDFASRNLEAPLGWRERRLAYVINGRAVITDFNFTHPLLQQIADPADIVEVKAPDELVVDDAASDVDAEDPMLSPLAVEIWELSREVASLQAIDRPLLEPPAKTDELDASKAGVRNPEFAVRCATATGALPNLDRPLWLDLVEVDETEILRANAQRGDRTRASFERPYDGQGVWAEELVDDERRRRIGLSKLLDELMLGPLRIMRDHLQEMTYIGPLREIPRRSFRPRLSPDDSRWAHGLAAWDVLYTDTSGKLVERVNDWLSGVGKLSTGYRLEKFAFKEVPVPSRFHQIFERGLNEEDLGELQELYASLDARTEIALRDFGKGIIVAPSDVGVGISQMIPVIVASVRESDGILAVEQPELHVHPAIQVGLGDLFIEAIEPDEARTDLRPFLLPLRGRVLG